MNTLRVLVIGTCTALLGALGGCHQPSMAEMMKRPERPAALDQLNAWVGTWKGESKMTMPKTGETMTSTGTSEIQWKADGWLLVEDFSGTLENGQTMKGIGIWAYDSKIKKYRFWWFTDWNMISEGTAWYDADENKWMMRGKSRDLATGQTWKSKSEATFVDETTLNWEGSEYVGLIPMKILEMEGVSHRQ